MWGRFSLSVELPVVLNRFGIPQGPVEWHPRYNIAPTQACLTVIEENHHRLLVPMSWGLIPHWSKDKKSAYKMINARAETINQKPSYRESFRKRRCLVPADGYFEWKKIGKDKIPFRATLKNGELFAFAGLWDSWEDENKNVIRTFSLITTEANPLLTQFHDRMPVILNKEGEEIWMNHDQQDTTKLEQLMKPYPGTDMSLYEVSPVVNSWKIDSAECLQPSKPKKE